MQTILAHVGPTMGTGKVGTYFIHLARQSVLTTAGRRVALHCIMTVVLFVLTALVERCTQPSFLHGKDIVIRLSFD